MPKKTKGSDTKSRFMNKQIDLVDKHFAILSEDLTTVTRTGQKMADRFGAYAKNLQLYAEAETPGIKQSLSKVSLCVQGMEEFRRQQLTLLDTRVTDRLKGYQNRTKQLKVTIAEREKLKKLRDTKKKFAETMTSKEANQDKFFQAKREKEKAERDLRDTENNLLKDMKTFQSDKIADLKSIQSDFITTQMEYHMRSLELLTAAFQSLHYIDEDKNLEYTELERTGSRASLTRGPSAQLLQQSLSQSRPPGESQYDDLHDDDDDDEYDHYL
eukprot:m.88933 g.88933  ORF g.88933 m.88933 type:complete len:271 (-) comp21485_c0_seq1:157-969(-)